MRKFCEWLAKYISSKHMIDEKDENALRFGIELILTQFITLFTILIVGALLGKLFESIIYCILFVFARRVFEGYHAKTFLMCYILTISHFIILMCIMYFHFPFYLLNLISPILIFFYVKNNQDKKRKVCQYIIFYSIVIIWFGITKNSILVNLSSLILLSVLCVSHLGGEKDEYCNS